MCFTNLIIILQILAKANSSKGIKKWYIGRVPPSSFEYPQLNGFYSPKIAKYICESDLKCGGFTYKGTKKISYIVPEIYFFHFINESANYLTTEIKYPHWSTYIVGSRDYVVIGGSYELESCLSGKILNQ